MIGWLMKVVFVAVLYVTFHYLVKQGYEWASFMVVFVGGDCYDWISDYFRVTKGRL